MAKKKLKKGANSSGSEQTRRRSKFYNLSMERAVLRVIFRNQKRYRDLLNSGFRPAFFSDESNSRLFSLLTDFYRKYRKAPTKKSANAYVESYIEKDDVDFYLNSIKRIYSPITKKERESLRHYSDELERLWKLRESQFKAKELANSIDKGDIDKIGSSFREGLSVILQDSTSLSSEGSPLQDFQERKRLVIQKQNNPELFTSVTTGIQELDRITGGFYKGEMYIVGGATGIGKSLALQEAGFMAYKGGANVVYCTIEMNKWKTQTRFDARATGIPYSKFKNGTLNKKDMKRWEEKLKNLEKAGGNYHVIAFNRGCSAFDLEHKCLDYCSVTGKDIDLIVVDYLNDMKAITTRGGKSSKDWDIIGEISWDVSLLSKYWNNDKGVPIYTANQAKTGTRNKETFKPEDLSFSPLPAQHATGIFGITQTPEDEMYGRLLFHVAKGRDNETGVRFPVYPNYQICKFHSLKKKREMEQLEDANGEYDNDEDEDTNE